MSSPPLPPHPIFNTTYTLHALTPLFSFPPFTIAALKPHSRQLLQLIRGDVLRGVAIPPTTTEAAQLSRAGKLLRCEWTPLPPPYTGARIELVYESAAYTALLIACGEEVKEGFTSLPLLLSRMPASLRATVLYYLSTAFDTLALPLALPDRLLRTCIDGYIASSGGGGGKDVVLTFSPREKGTGALKRVTFTIVGEDVGRFFERAGKEEGFLGVLGRHLETAMGLRVEEIDLVKVAAGGFVLAAEGKGKFFEGGGEAAREVVGLVIREAAGRGER